MDELLDRPCTVHVHRAPSQPPADRSWLELAACRGKPSSWWFATTSFETAVAVQICKGCEVKERCLSSALVEEADGRRFGIRGGKLASERRAP